MKMSRAHGVHIWLERWQRMWEQGTAALHIADRYAATILRILAIVVITLLAGIVTTPLNRTQLVLPIGAGGLLLICGIIAWLSMTLCMKNGFARLAGGLRMVILLVGIGGVALIGTSRMHLPLSAALATLVISVTSGLIGLCALEESVLRQDEATARSDGELAMRIAEGGYLVAIAGIFALPLLPAALLHAKSLSFLIIRVVPVAGGVVMAWNMLERTRQHAGTCARLLQRLGWQGLAAQVFILISPAPFSVGWVVALLLLLVQVFVIHHIQQQMITAAADGAFSSDVMGQISHDVLNPLNAMLQLTSYLDQVVQKDYADTQLPGVTKRLLSMYQRFEHQIDLLLDFAAQHATATVPLTIENVSPHDIVQRIIADEQVLAPAPITLDLLPPPGERGRALAEGALATWDKRRIEAVVANLLTNALKYGRRQPIAVHLWQSDPEHIVLDVVDQGIGMAPETVKHIFDVYYRANDALSQNGHGLGLAMVKTVVDAHGGTIKVRSTRGKGTLVRVTLPRDVQL
jgi:signal transduction histidine kinase